MKKYLLLLSLLSSPALAETWATGECTTQSGTKIRYMIHDGEGFITYNNSEPAQIFSTKDGNLGIITHIGNVGNMTMAIDLTNGRGYLVTRRDDGKKIETNVFCKLGGFNR